MRGYQITVTPVMHRTSLGFRQGQGPGQGQGQGQIQTSTRVRMRVRPCTNVCTSCRYSSHSLAVGLPSSFPIEVRTDGCHMPFGGTTLSSFWEIGTPGAHAAY